VINLTQHPSHPRDLLIRRFTAIVGRPVEGLADRLNLDRQRRAIPAGAEIVSAGAGGPEALLVVSGVAGETRLLADGRRQVLSLRLPGDILQSDAQEAVTALSAVEVVDILSFVRGLADRGAESQGLRRAWLGLARLEQGMLRDHIVRLGRLSAYERLAHVLVEIHERLLHVGLATMTSFHLPIRQEVMADLLGLSVVHLSRTTQQLRRDRLAQTRSGYVTLLDRERLAQIANYTSRFAAPVAPSRLATPVEALVRAQQLAASS
jgi:CRP-like cAMP-binding protein